MKQATLFITGNVIGVGFRSFIKHHAVKRNLTGYARNVYAPKKGVECIVEGNEEDIKMLIEECKKGPDVSWVENITVQYSELKKYTFESFTTL